MSFFERPYTVRRFEAPFDEEGCETADYYEKTFNMDVQVVVPSGAEANPEGQRKSKRLNSWGDNEMITADATTGTRGDWLLYRGQWYECTSCEHRDHTILHHWRGEWTRLPEGSEKHDGHAAAVFLTPTG
jgi:hypothetical protein